MQFGLATSCHSVCVGGMCCHEARRGPGVGVKGPTAVQFAAVLVFRLCWSLLDILRTADELSKKTNGLFRPKKLVTIFGSVKPDHMSIIMNNDVLYTDVLAVPSH